MVTVTATTPTLTPYALPQKQFLLCRLLSLSRLLIYSSSCCAFRCLFLSCRPPVSMTALPPLLLLWCPDASCCETLTSTLVSNVFLVMVVGGGKRGGRTQQSAKRGTCSEDASDRGDATGNNKPAQQKDKRVAQQWWCSGEACVQQGGPIKNHHNSKTCWKSFNPFGTGLC